MREWESNEWRQIKLVLHVLCRALLTLAASAANGLAIAGRQLNNVLSFKTVQDGNAKTFLSSPELLVTTEPSRTLLLGPGLRVVKQNK